MSKKLFIYFLYFVVLPLSFQSCSPNMNHCIKCSSNSDLCIQCDKNIYKPDINGGCEFSKSCKYGQNYCSSCNSNNLCSSCELGYYPDENGGCATTENCLASYKGECLQCAEDFYLVGIDKFKYCKYKYGEDIKNCESINITSGLCINCTKGYFMNLDDNKCIEIENCRESLYGICSECDLGFYLDKRDDKCKNWDEIKYCKISVDGENCDECIDNYYLTKNGRCVETNYCEKSDKNSVCQKCVENYYLNSNDNNICTTEKNCEEGDKDFGSCRNCQYLYYLNIDTGKCISNQENNDFKFCKTVEKNKCIDCIYDYYLTPDSKCVKSKNCTKSENGICSKCDEGYHLTLDNKCTDIEHCDYLLYNGCKCEKNYYFDKWRKKCYLQINQYKNCKISDYVNEKCLLCDQGYYLYSPNKLCYDNSEEGSLHRCEKSDENGILCDTCQEGYYLGFEDLKCTKIDGCLVSENENKCTKCDESYCFDVNKKTCIYNDLAPESEDEKIYYACNKTNEKGTECALCRDEFFSIENGICVNNVECEEEENGKCIKCNEISHEGMKMCLNNVFGCVETFAGNCLRCNNMFNFDECTECDKGYELNDKGKCVEI